MKKGISNTEILQMARTTVGEGEAENQNEEELETLQQEQEGIVIVGEGNVLVSISDDAGIRVSKDVEEEEASLTKRGKRKRVDETFHSQ
jgi:hypothetical protein